MWSGGVVFLVLSVVSVLGQTDRLTQDNSAQRPVFYIYPHTGRLFHADYVKDNQIFKSLERTNFMRRGLFAKRLKSDEVAEEEKKKHIYLELGKITIEDMKKRALEKVKSGPSKENFVKATTDKIKGETRPKREVDTIEDRQAVVSSTAPITSEESVSGVQISNQRKEEQFNSNSTKPEDLNLRKTNTTEQGGVGVPEKMVEGDFVTHAKNNDTDKTLLIRDSRPHENEALKSTILKPPILSEGSMMKKIVMDERMMLYPVYRGAISHYPYNERSLLYSPQLAVQMDLPEVTEYIPAASDNFTTDSEHEGRSKRPLKKLALPLLLALKLKTAIMLPLILGLVSLVALKGLWSGLTALGISAALGLKALVTSSAPRVVVQSHPPPPPPHIHHFPPHEYTEYWSRSDNNYNDYRPNSWT